MAKTHKYTKTDLMLAIRGDPSGGKPAPIKDNDGQIDIMADRMADDTRKTSYGHIPTIAKRLNCSDQTVRNYLSDRERLPEYKILMGLLRDVRLAIKESDSGVYDLVKQMASTNQGDRFQLSDIIEQLINGLDMPDVKLGPILAAIKSKIVSNTWGDLTKQAKELQAACEQEKKRGLLERADFHHELKTKAEIALLVNIELGDVQASKFVLERLDKENYSSRSEITADFESLFDSETLALMKELGVNINDAMAIMAEAIRQDLFEAKNNTHSMRSGE